MTARKPGTMSAGSPTVDPGPRPVGWPHRWRRHSAQAGQRVAVLPAGRAAAMVTARPARRHPAQASCRPIAATYRPASHWILRRGDRFAEPRADPAGARLPDRGRSRRSRRRDLVRAQLLAVPPRALPDHRDGLACPRALRFRRGRDRSQPYRRRRATGVRSGTGHRPHLRGGLVPRTPYQRGNSRLRLNQPTEWGVAAAVLGMGAIARRVGCTARSHIPFRVVWAFSVQPPSEPGVHLSTRRALRRFMPRARRGSRGSRHGSRRRR